MSNEVATKKENTAVAALAGLKRGVQNVRQAIPTSSTVPILRMGTDGIWVYGQENVEVEEESRWAINPISIMHGYVCWANYPKEAKKKNELLGEVYASMSGAPIDPASLPKHLDADGDQWPWKPATSVQLKCMDGEDEGTQVVYKPSSVGGANVMQRLLDAIEKQLDTGTDEIVPIVELTNDHYQHKQYGKTYVPEFKIVDWVTMDGPTEGDDADEPAPEPEEKPAKKEGKKKAEKQPDPEPEANDGDDSADAEAPADAEEPKTEGRTRRRRRSS